MEYGDPDGYGRYGQLTYIENGKRVVCHECGAARRALGLHVRVHGMTADEYRARHGLSTGQGLAAPATAARFSEIGRSPAALAALAAHRDPDRARAANTREANLRAQRRAIRRQTGHLSRLGRALTPAEVAELAAAPSIAAWSAIAWRLVADGASRRSISRATGIPPATVDGRMRRYPPAEQRA